MKCRRHQSEQGIALIMSIFMTVIATLIVGALAMSWQPDVDFVTKARIKEMAYQAADAGMRQAESFLFSTFYARLGSPENPQTVPLIVGYDTRVSPRTLGENTEGPCPLTTPPPPTPDPDTAQGRVIIPHPLCRQPVNGIDNIYSGVFSELDKLFYGTQDGYGTPNTAVNKPVTDNLRALVWPSQTMPDNRRVRYKVMMMETATTTTNNSEDRAIDTYSRQVTIYSVGAITHGDAVNIPLLVPEVNCTPKVVLKKRIIFQVRRRRGWAASFLDPAPYAASVPVAYTISKAPTLSVLDSTLFNKLDEIIFSQRSGAVLGNEKHTAGTILRPPSNPTHDINVAGAPYDTGTLNYDYQAVDANRPLVVSTSRSTLPLLTPAQFVTAIRFYLFNKVLADSDADKATLVNAGDAQASFLTKDTGGVLKDPSQPNGPRLSGVNDLTRWNAFIWYISAGSAGVTPPWTDVTTLVTKGWLPDTGDASRTVYDKWRNEFIANVKSGTVRDLPPTDLIVDSTYTDYLLQLTYRKNLMKPPMLSIPYPTSTYPIVSKDSSKATPFNYAVVGNPDADYTDWIQEFKIS